MKTKMPIFHIICTILIICSTSCKNYKHIVGFYKNPTEGSWERYLDYKIKRVNYSSNQTLQIYADSTFMWYNPCYCNDSGKWYIEKRKLICQSTTINFTNDSLQKCYENGTYKFNLPKLKLSIRKNILKTKKVKEYRMVKGTLVPIGKIKGQQKFRKS